MGRSKKKPNPPPPLPANTATGAPPPPTNNPNQEQTQIDQEFSLIKSKCNDAIAAQNHGNTAEAFTLMEETRRHCEYSNLVHATQCKLHVQEASRIGTPDNLLLFQNHVRNAIEWARRVVSVSPDSITLGDFYAATLYKLSSSLEGFDEVLTVCEQALLVDNPLQHCRDASLSFKGWVYEERCRMSESKKQAVSKENERAEMKMEKSRSYWNEMSDERKRELIGLKIGDLREYYTSFCKDGIAKRVFSEGIDYAEKNKNWRFWSCYYCDDKFEDFELRKNHIEQNHGGLIEQNLQIKPFLFPEIDADGGGSEVYHDLQTVNGTIHIIKERIVLTGDSLGPLAKRLLRVCHHGVEDDENGSASTCSICDAKVRVSTDIDAFGQWVFDGPPTSTAEELSTWTHLQDQMKLQGMEVPMRFEEEFFKFQSLRRKQSELMVQTRSIRGIQIICAQELNKRKQGGESVPYKSLLREKLEPLVKTKEDSMSPTQKSELAAIVGLLKEAGNVRHSESNLLKASGVEDEEDTFIRVAIHKKMSELFTNEARITKSRAVMLRLLVIYTQSSLDYRGIMLPLVRNFIHAELEKQKADAATKALLSELALEAEKNTSKGNSHPKLSKRSSKAETTVKDHREVKDSKDTCSESSNKIIVAEEEKAEQPDFPVPAATADELKLQERLDYQRQFEEEAKQSALAKEATNEAAPAKDTCSKSSDKLTVAEEEKAEQAYFPVVAGSADELKLQEKEHRDFIQEDIKPSEMLGNQRQFEDMAKQMALAKETTNEAALLKATCSKELTVAQEDEAEQAQFPVVAASATALVLPEEEFRKNIVKEDRKPEDMLVYKRESEDESKQMDLVKETTSEAALIKIEESDKPVVVFSQRTERRRMKDILHTCKNLRSPTIPKLEKDTAVLSTCGRFGTTSGSYRYNPGLRNHIGDYNCFVNVVVQSLWHLRKFRGVFMSGSTSEHVHIGDPCVVCALHEIFGALSVASTNYQREALSPTSLRNALNKLNPFSDGFSKPAMYDTSDLLGIILYSLHESSTLGSKPNHQREANILQAIRLDILGKMWESAETKYAPASWACRSNDCIAHNVFGMYFVEKVFCFSCGIEYRKTKYITCFHSVRAGTLIITKNMHPASHFDELFKLGDRRYNDYAPQFACHPPIGHCGKQRRVLRDLTRSPHVFAIALFWYSESKEDMSAILRAMTTEIDLAVIHDGLASGNKHSLSSMVCYAGQHHICFAYNHELEIWVLYDDENVKNVGRWEDIICICEEGHLRPHLLFFEAVK